MKPVALVSMPTLAARFPSFQLALLTPTLRRAGFEVEPMSLFLRFGEQVGWDLNEALADVYPCMVGEWIWARTAFGDVGDQDAYTERYRSNLEAVCTRAGCTVDDLVALREHGTASFVDRMMREVDWSSYGIVGFSVVFQQMAASIAMAKAIKREHPQVPVIFGGATFEDDIAAEVIQHTPEVDYVHCGDADVTLPDIVARVYSGTSPKGVPGIMCRDEGETVYAGRSANVTDLDSTPIPDFDEYFATSDRTGYTRRSRREVMLPIETARGCWYGMKHHCTFCGLNRAGMDFRRKHPDQVLEMLKVLSRRYGTRYFNAIDNIMAPAYVSRLFGRLAEGHSDLRLHYEIRPKLTRTQLGEMRRGGLYSVQPGIESFSTHVLGIMQKNTSGMRNLELLKWTTYYGIDNAYNILFGFPGETVDDYRAQADLMGRISHLQPPYAMARARPDRGSPMYERPGVHSIGWLRPAGCYQHIYPPDFDLRRVSYFFEHGVDGALPDAAYDECLALVAAWQARWHRRPPPQLHYVKGWDTISIHDERGENRRSHRFDDDAAALYEFCGDARSMPEIVERFDLPQERLEAALRDFVDKDLLVELDDQYLSLALPDNRHH